MAEVEPQVGVNPSHVHWVMVGVGVVDVAGAVCLASTQIVETLS